jgi:large subunit ribosomal protein L4
MSVQVRSQNGDVVEEIELDAQVFGAQVNVPLMHQVVRAQLAAARAGTHDTKRRGEVSGGGKKPWRQKGTGRARQGSTRAPQWEGGGVVFGPHPRDHSLKVPKKMRAGALRSALSDRAKDNLVFVVDKFDFDEPKTQRAAEALEALDLSGKILLVLDTPDPIVAKSFRNIPGVHLLLAHQLNTYDVLASDAVLFTRAALDQVGKGGKATAEAAPAATTEAAPAPDAAASDEEATA